MNIITLHDLSTAIEEKLDIEKTQAKKIALKILDFFGFDDRIIDNNLEQDERQLFYMLESHGLVQTQREIVTLMNGRQWRIHYWILAKKTILKYTTHTYQRKKYPKITPSHQDTIYSYLNKDMWISRKLDV